MIPVHNCAELLARALPQVVEQLGGRDDVEIVVVDDGSSDDPQSVVDRFPGVVRCVRNEEALGAVANFNHCLDLSRGRLVHLLHGDDRILPGYYDAMEAAFRRRSVAAAFCRTQYIDDRDGPLTVTRSEGPSGPWAAAVDCLAVSNRIRPVSIVVRREVYERVGGFREDLPHAADWEMWMRVAAAGTIWFEDQVLAQYRVHDGQDTAARVRDGVNIRERVEAIRIISDHLDTTRRLRLARAALGYSALFAFRTAGRQAGRGDLAAAVAQAREAIRCLGLAATGVGAGDDTHDPIDITYLDSLRRCSHIAGDGTSTAVPVTHRNLTRPDTTTIGRGHARAEHRQHVAP